MMFALPAIRNSNPGIPPIGTLFDVYSFLYAQFMISFVAAGLIVYYIARASNAAPSPMGPILNRSDTDIKGAEAAGISNTMSVSGGQALSSIDASAAGAAAMNVDMQIDGGLGSMSMPS